MPPSTITITGVRARGFHGVLESERETGQIFIVDATMEVDTGLATQYDEVNYTVDYGEVAQTIGTTITDETFNLIETLAEVIATKVMDQQPLLRKISVTVHKPQAPIALDFQNISVTVHRGRP